MTTTIPRAEDLVQRLGAIPAGDHWVVSCYLKLEPRDRMRGKYLIKLKNRIKEQEAWIESQGLSRAARQQVSRDLERIYRHLEHPSHLPAGRGIAVFASEPIDVFEAVTLPTVYRSRVAIDHTPLVRQVVALAEEFGVMLAAVHDRKAARFFRLSAFGIVELTGLAAGITMRPGKFHGDSAPTNHGGMSAGFGEHNYHQRLQTEKHRHYHHIGEALLRLHRETPATGILLGGIGAEAGAVRPFLHSYLNGLALEPARLNVKTASPNDVFTAALEARQARERELEQAHAAELRERLPHGWALNGIDATLKALGAGQVRTLLVDPEKAAPGFRCSASGRLTVSERPCRSEGEAEPVADVIDEAVEEALAQRAEVDVLFDPEARASVDGLAALLRFQERRP
jgi:peptide subunit release factor 1 (eRF1)